MRAWLVTISCFLTAALIVPTVQADDAASTGVDWPQWRGPNRDGHSAEKGLLAEFPKDGPKLLWKKTELTDIGTGYGSACVVADKIFIMGADGNKQTAQEFVTCLELNDGKQVWQTKLETSAGKFLDGWGGGPRCTPTYDSGSLYILGATGDLAALNVTDGKLLWSKNLVNDFQGSIPQWGYSESVLIDGDQLVVTPGSKGGMLCLNKKSGEIIWQCIDFNDGAGYSSIVISEAAGVKQYVQQTMVGAVGVAAKDGKLLWKAGELARRTAVIPTPVLQDDYVFLTAGYNAGCECFQLVKDGDGVKANTVYTKSRVLDNHHGGVVRVGDYVYGHADRNGWVCYNLKKGGDEPVWSNRGVGKGSCSYADGYLYCFSEQTGKLARVKADPTDYVEKDSFTIPELSKLRPRSGKVWAHPVIVNGKLLLRDYDLLYVYDISAK